MLQKVSSLRIQMKKHKHVGQASHIQDGVRWLFSVLILHNEM